MKLVFLFTQDFFEGLLHVSTHYMHKQETFGFVWYLQGTELSEFVLTGKCLEDRNWKTAQLSANVHVCICLLWLYCLLKCFISSCSFPLFNCILSGEKINQSKYEKSVALKVMILFIPFCDSMKPEAGICMMVVKAGRILFAWDQRVRPCCRTGIRSWPASGPIHPLWLWGAGYIERTLAEAPSAGSCWKARTVKLKRPQKGTRGPLKGTGIICRAPNKKKVGHPSQLVPSSTFVNTFSRMDFLCHFHCQCKAAAQRIYGCWKMQLPVKCVFACEQIQPWLNKNCKEKIRWENIQNLCIYWQFIQSSLLIPYKTNLLLVDNNRIQESESQQPSALTWNKCSKD